MTSDEARTLKKDDPVQWDTDSNDKGIVTFVAPDTVHIKWDNCTAIGVYPLDSPINSIKFVRRLEQK